MSSEQRHLSTRVCIIGAGPAGFILACLLQRSQISCLIVERRSHQDTLEQAPRAGYLEHTTTQLLTRAGLQSRMMREGHANGSCEFRLDGQGFVFDYAALCQGCSHWVYPQRELIADLLESHLQEHGTILFGTEAVQILQDARPQVICRQGNSDEPISITCDFVAGCDGFHGVSRTSIPQGELQAFERYYGFQWLAIQAAVPPSSNHTIYAIHPHGFAGHLTRTATQTRFYLQVPSGTKLADWSEAQIWTELDLRLAKDGWTLTRGPINGTSLLEMRSCIVEPLYYKHLALLGDAAHIFTPAGAKGMNLAIQDAFTLANLLQAFYKGDEKDPLRQYSTLRLPHIWHAQEFSHWMVETLNRNPTDSSLISYHHRLQQARLARLQRSRTFATSFAENYIGYSPQSSEG
ncbi:4-hydroxybenzoate 3-monooxygenase [Ktedonosporobacter rubrisoli]|uniref:4-hydroxybenzoate 3-monooxygenase n=1 Tax=Ktedonosporobacter rubrisoli TaxID=2509675 RepID=A0A4P6JWN7_KTERU|nr:4-hydroxybenzoate 3-monooxygenase [Ktedonosporobacter rubrisoli]QBD79800.1 4-hydroxybenzoate 3-monooxygenase [Ktedonosporobacter rubrisoli]